MVIEAKRLTYDDYLRLPETVQRYEIIDGEIRMSPSPTPVHQRILLRLAMKMATYVQERQLGEIFVAPLDLVVSREPLRVRQPDLMFVHKDRSEVIGAHHLEGAPDLVVEVLSPENTRREIQDKLADYARIGVREIWLVSPEAQTVEVLQASSHGGLRRLGIWGSGEQVRSEVLPDFPFSVDEVFAP